MRELSFDLADCDALVFGHAQALGLRIRRRPLRPLRLDGELKDGDPRAAFAPFSNPTGMPSSRSSGSTTTPAPLHA